MWIEGEHARAEPVRRTALDHSDAAVTVLDGCREFARLERCAHPGVLGRRNVTPKHECLCSATDRAELGANQQLASRGRGEWLIPDLAAPGLDDPERPGRCYCLHSRRAFCMLTRLYRQHHPHATFGAANYVTLIRAVLTLVLLWIVTLAPGPRLAWIGGWMAGAVAALDGVDGWLARRSGMWSTFGARFDMETDAALLLVLSILALRFGKAGLWVLLIGLMRYLFVAAGWLLPWLNGPLTPTRRGKTVAVVQMVTLAISLVMPRSASSTAAATALTLLVWSFAIDVGRLWRARPQAT